MVNFETSPWKIANAQLALYRYFREDRGAVYCNTPVLLLHGPMTNHRTWDTLADYFWQQGFSDLYAADLSDLQIANPLQSHAVEALAALVTQVLAAYPAATRLVLIGHSTGGVLARRFLFKSPLAGQILYLFSLTSPHHRTNFTHTVYVPPEDDPSGTSTPFGSPSGIYKNLRKPAIFQATFAVNFFGNSVGPDFDGTVRGVYLPEAINIVLPLGHAVFKQHISVLDEMLECMRGNRYRVQLYLQNLLMRPNPGEKEVGPFCFEINGMRSPYDGIFQAEGNVAYTFDEENTPLATLAYPNRQTLASLIFRLKDFSRNHSTKRRLFAKLLVTLGDDITAVHEMQDSQGSQLVVRVDTQRMPPILDTP